MSQKKNNRIHSNSISIVVPSFKRTENLIRLLKSIEIQSILPDEIIIVAAGYNEEDLKIKLSGFDLPIQLIFSQPSVCKQRNIGIKNTSSTFIQLCDDDIEIPENYLETLSGYLQSNPEVKIVSGEEIIQNSNLEWASFNQKISFFGLTFRFIFGLSLWSDLRENTTNNFVYKKLLGHYIKKGNTISKAGWPIVSNFSKPIMKTTIYGLGCAMFRSHDLKSNLYDETLEQHGLGDNYDVAIRVNQHSKKIHVIRNTHYKHYKATSNRLTSSKQYYYRTKTLLTFIKKLSFFNFKTKLYFLWSLLGNGLHFLLTGRVQHFYENIRIILFTIKSIFTLNKAHS